MPFLLALLLLILPLRAEALAPLELRDVTDAYTRWIAENPPDPAGHPEPGYHFLAEVHAALAPWVARRPGVVRPFMAGRTVKGRPIWGYVIHDPGCPVQARVLVFANMHAIEWVGTEDTLALALEQAAQPMPGVELVVIPVLNVDGRLRVEADLAAGENTFRRTNAHGVDLNRDFGVHHEAESFWRRILPGFHRASPEPLSQPESQAVDHLAGLGHFDLAVSLHAYGGFVYLPWSGRWERPPGWPALHELGVAMSGGQGPHAYRVLQLSRWGFFFRAQGSEIDHLYGKYGIPATLVECTRTGLSPFRPGEWGNHFRVYNPADPSRHVREGLRLLRAGMIHAARGVPARPLAVDGPS
ncbi:MAG: M14 family metallopeptidase [Pseudomonadota bacterium]